MISYIKGELVEVTENSIVLDHQGMGFSIMMPGSILDKLPQIGSELKVHTYLYVKEDILDLYGFLTRDDLKIFKLLITVNGIGPKGALAILIEDVLDGAGEGYVSQDNMADTASAEAVMALTSLGYSAADATRAVRMVENVQSMDSEAILKAALKKLAFM